MRNLCAVLVVVASLAWITGIDGQSIEAEFTGSERGVFIASCVAQVPEPGRTITINFEGTGGLLSPTQEPSPGMLTRVRTFFSRAATDSGVYTCTLTIDGVITDTIDFVIDFPDAVVFNISLSQPPGPATVGMDYNITCRANFKTPVNGMVTFEWRDPDNNPISTSDGFAIMTTLNEFSVLRLNPVQESQAGAYTCLATSSSGITLNKTSDEVVVNAGVAFNLSISQPPGPAIAGADYTITCEAAVNGMATYQWRGPDNNPLFLSDGFAILTQGGISMLLFDPARESQAGVYTCFATFSGVTVNQTSAEVVVNVPEITLDIVSTNQPVLGQNYSFICEVTIAFDISPTITYSLTRNSQIYFQNQPFVLSFEPLTLADAGMYLCSAIVSSPYINDDVNVEVEQVLNFTIPTPTVRLNITPALPLPHLSSPRLTCRVDFMEVNIAATITVTINGTNRPNSGAVTFPIENVPRSVSNITTNVDLQNITCGDGDGLYTCTAHIVANEFQPHISNSEVGMDSLDVVVLKEPPQPFQITVMVVDSQSVMIEWTQEPTDVVDTYFVDTLTTPIGCTADVDSVPRQILDGLQTSTTIQDLEEFSEITINITAINPFGSNSELVVFQTQSAAPGEIQSVNTSATNGISITISWDRLDCLERNSDIVGYMVTYRMTPDEIRPTRQTTEEMVAIITGTGPENRTFTATGLLPQTSYTFIVQANSSEGLLGPTTSTTDINSGIPNEVGIVHNGQIITNNSIITVDDIGQDFQRIICYTNMENCCDSLESGEMGQWLLPGGTLVPESSTGENIIVERGPSVVGFTRVSEEAVASGLLRCDIPDRNGTVQSFFVGVYSSDQAEGQPTLRGGIEYDRRSSRLICESTGGPATYITWRRNGIETSFNSSQYVTDTLDATYVNVLELWGEPQDIIGNHSCQVVNPRGITERSTIELRGLQVFGLEESYDAGESVTVMCTTDLNFNRVIWLDDDGTSLTKQSSVPLQLPMDSFTETTQFRCRIESDFGQQEMAVTITINERAPIGAIVGGTVGGLFALFLCALLILIICCCLGIHCRRRIEKKHPAHLEMGTYRPTMPMEDDEDGFENGDVISTRAELVEGRENGYNKITDAESVEDIHTSFVNEEAIYVNSTFKARDRGAPIPVGEFESLVQQMHTGKNFETEYMLISRTPQFSYDISCIPENKIRNRFGNIFPYDNNRVVLSTISGVKGSDYINASFIDRNKREKAYIAAQGPKAESLSDFWRMIWEYKIPTIAMLTRCYEGGKKKCVQYFPEKLEEPLYPGQNLSVSLTSIMSYATYTIRKMAIRNTAEPDTPPLEVIQFHFLGWPDHGVPTNAMTVINFIKQIRKTHPYSSEDLMLVHCSAGVGRTGTFIALDAMLESINEDGTVAIFPFVKRMREQRVLMIQTLVQYSFVYDALNEYIICGQTEIPAAKMRETYEELSEKLKGEGGTETTGFEQQFQLLNHMTHVIPDAKCGHAKAPYNTTKNRYSNRIPNYFTRVRLRPTAVEGSDYINASFIDGYKATQAFIATQGPLEGTVHDFWKMIYEYRSKCIVMLCNLEEDGQEASHMYWPKDVFKPEVYGKITVIKTTEEVFPDYIFRKFEVTGVPPKSMVANNNLSPSFIVSQFQYVKWQENETPEETASLIEVMEKVSKVQMNTGNKAITVMCNNGVGRTGTFLAMYSQMERLKNEGEADIFQYIKAVRIQRGGLILDAQEYAFSHRVLADYLNNFGEDANSKQQ